ncbi:ATP-binding protein [Streptomyces sp. S.PNR 29]|uniref:ATP-binding protein n=1 Tax=Streptomyces sp. S.PNR 29 TaxID=2973805 RepID=UPI0025B11B21|nr:ATP-binding protein [Streptomyces sp. S.PNR 29]MDN0197853.1 ATP-binding protein [Streptomyces sp. S.PNR 29]
MSSPAPRALRPLSQLAPRAGAMGQVGGLSRTARSASAGERPIAQPGSPGGRPVSVALRIACDRDGFARARAFTRDTLRGWSLDHRSDDALLVITELASNAVTHAMPSAAAGGTEVGLGLALDPGHLTLSVCDSDDNPPVYPPPDGADLDEHGRGLCIVDALSEEWGWTPRPPAGKTVWARLSTVSPHLT